MVSIHHYFASQQVGVMISVDPLASDPECIKVKDWRHKLQRAFLGKGLPTANVCGIAIILWVLTLLTSRRWTRMIPYSRRSRSTRQ